MMIYKLIANSLLVHFEGCSEFCSFVLYVAQKLETGTSDVDVEITLPSIPKSKEEFLQSWAERYVQNKAMLSSKYFNAPRGSAEEDCSSLFLTL